MNGIIVIDKEPGFTSHDVVAKLRGICRQKKIGHTGTLDPQATGVLPVCLGNATKLCDLLTDRDKEYEAQLLLGVETDTQDMTGKILRECPVDVTEEEAREALMSFVGSYSQIPPMYSALKVEGRKLYELARAGREVEREPREVFVRSIEILECRIPLIRFRAVVSKGTYIRTLCADAGAKLGCGGAMRSLRRTRVGDFNLSDSCTLSRVQTLRDEGRLEEILIPVDEVFRMYPAICVKPEWGRLLDNGNPLLPEQVSRPDCGGEAAVGPGEREARSARPGCGGETAVGPGRVRVYRQDGSFAGIYVYDESRSQYRPVKMFL